jgi:hypothetical protein
MNKYIFSLKCFACAGISSPRIVCRLLGNLASRVKAEEWVANYHERGLASRVSDELSPNPLEEFFQSKSSGHGIWKWTHYFDIYHRHFSKFRNKSPNILEIGIYSGGSLEMWRSYFGDGAHIYGVDIEEACLGYENEQTTVFVGDQGDRSFWKSFRESTPPIDVLIDDGGHTPEQQRTTLEEMLPHMRLGSVYCCEDVHGKWNDFAAYATSLVNDLNHSGDQTEFQNSVHSIHFYPFCVVIEKHLAEPRKFVAPRHGTIWQPFYDKENSDKAIDAGAPTAARQV